MTVEQTASAPQSDNESAHTYAGMRFKHPLPFPPSLPSYISENARRYGAQPYLTCVGVDRHTTLSYVELDERSRRLAGHLTSELRLNTGQVVALIPSSDVASVVMLFAVLRTGAAALLLSPADPVDRLRQQVAAVSAAVVLRSRSVPSDCLVEAMCPPDSWTAREAPNVRISARRDPSAPALYFGTSGSTAASKMVTQSYYNAAVNAHAVCSHHELRHGERILGCLPLHHVNGVHFTLMATLAAGAHCVMMEQFDPFLFLEALRQFRPRIASVAPSVLEALLDAHGRVLLADSFEYFVSAAAPLTMRTARAVSDNFGARVLQGYGLTETTNFSTTIPTGLPDALYRRVILDADIPSIGVALYGNEVAVLREDGTPSLPGETGEICMRGHNVMLGYAGNPLATAEAFRGGWFHSQDLGFKVFDAASGNRFFVLTGRIKNVVKVGGEAVSLEEMERILRGLPEVRDAACFARPHRLLGEEIVAVIVGSSAVSTEQIRRHLRNTFAAAALPRRVVQVTAIPRTATGKLHRGELAQQLASSGDPMSLL